MDTCPKKRLATSSPSKRCADLMDFPGGEDAGRSKRRARASWAGWRAAWGPRWRISRPRPKLQGYYEHDYSSFLAVIKKKGKKLAIDPARREPAEALRAEFEGSLGKLGLLRERIWQTDELIDAVVHRLYGLTEDERMNPSRERWYVSSDQFIFDADVSDFMAIPEEQLPDSFGSKSLFSGIFEVRLKMLVDLLADGLRLDARGLDDFPVLRQNLFNFNCFLLYIIDPKQVLFSRYSGICSVRRLLFCKACGGRPNRQFYVYPP